jgi:hypothetical protein
MAFGAGSPAWLAPFRDSPALAGPMAAAEIVAAARTLIRSFAFIDKSYAWGAAAPVSYRSGSGNRHAMRQTLERTSATSYAPRTLPDTLAGGALCGTSGIHG